MRYLKKIAIFLGAIALVVLGLDKIAGKPLLPGRDTGFEWHLDTSTSSPRLVLATDAGDISCVVELKIRSQVSPWIANLSNGVALTVTQSALGPGETIIVLSAPAKSTQEKFVWPSSINVLVTPGRNSQGGLSISDWTVFVNNDAYDSLSRSKLRTIWRWICGVLLFFGLVSIGHEALAKSETGPPFTAQVCVGILIDSVEGQDAVETKRMHTVLKKVLLEEVKVRHALGHIPLSPVEKQALWFRARSRFLDRLSSIINGLAEYQAIAERH